MKQIIRYINNKDNLLALHRFTSAIKQLANNGVNGDVVYITNATKLDATKSIYINLKRLNGEDINENFTLDKKAINYIKQNLNNLNLRIVYTNERNNVLTGFDKIKMLKDKYDIKLLAVDELCSFETPYSNLTLNDLVKNDIQFVCSQHAYNHLFENELTDKQFNKEFNRVFNTLQIPNGVNKLSYYSDRLILEKEIQW